MEELNVSLLRVGSWWTATASNFTRKIFLGHIGQVDMTQGLFKVHSQCSNFKGSFGTKNVLLSPFFNPRKPIRTWYLTTSEIWTAILHPFPYNVNAHDLYVRCSTKCALICRNIFPVQFFSDLWYSGTDTELTCCYGLLVATKVLPKILLTRRVLVDPTINWQKKCFFFFSISTLDTRWWKIKFLFFYCNESKIIKKNIRKNEKFIELDCSKASNGKDSFLLNGENSFNFTWPIFLDFFDGWWCRS